MVKVKRNNKNPKGKTHVTVGWMRRLEKRIDTLEKAITRLAYNVGRK